MDINKTILARDLSAKLGIPTNKAEATIDALTDLIKDYTTRGDKVALRGFGAFSGKFSEARVGRNPKTGDPVPIPAGTTLKFKPYGKL